MAAYVLRVLAIIMIGIYTTYIFFEVGKEVAQWPAREELNNLMCLLVLCVVLGYQAYLASQAYQIYWDNPRTTKRHIYRYLKLTFLLPPAGAVYFVLVSPILWKLRTKQKKQEN
jgi:hypothetical protein